MQAAAHNEAPADGLTLGARAGLELQLQDAQRDLAELVQKRNDLQAGADVESALACEPGRSTAYHNIRAASLRLSAFQLDPDLAAVRLRIRHLESQLKDSPAQAAPVVLSRDAVEGMDEMAGVL